MKLSGVTLRPFLGKKAADQGHALAQTKLGGMYCCGSGVRKDQAQGIRWYRRAAEQGEVAA